MGWPIRSEGLLGLAHGDDVGVGEHVPCDVDHLGGDGAWVDGVDPDVFGGVHHGGLPGQGRDATLGGVVGGHGHHIRLDIVDRGVVDDGAAAHLAHLRNGILYTQERALEVDAYDAVPDLLGLLVGVAGSVLVDAGVVEQDVESAVAVNRCVDYPLHILGLRYVSCDKSRFAASALDDADNLLSE